MTITKSEQDSLKCAVASLGTLLSLLVCDCHERSWYGKEHDTQCALYYEGDATRNYRKALKTLERLRRVESCG